MSKFTFNCPGCGEEISCDSSYIGYNPTFHVREQNPSVCLGFARERGKSG